MEFMLISKNIYRQELACKCGCGFDSCDFETINVVQGACDHFAKKLGVEKVVLNINCAARCEKHNKAVGGEDHSLHLQARAIDHTISGTSPKELADYYRTTYPNKYGIGEYKTFVHLDTRTNGPARWIK